MIRIIFLIVLSGMSVVGFAQYEGCLRVAARFDYQNFRFEHNAYQGGVGVEWFVADNFSLNYKLMMGHDQHRGAYLSSGFAQVGPLILASEVDITDELAALFVLAMLIPEGVSVYQPLGDGHSHIGVYLNPLNAEYLPSLKPRWYWSGELGARLLVYPFEEGFHISPHVGVRWFPGLDRSLSLSAGISVGWTFNYF